MIRLEYLAYFLIAVVAASAWCYWIEYRLAAYADRRANKNRREN